MTCTICGKATGPGAMLCRPCKSALKRARQLTVQDFPGTQVSVTMPGGLAGALRAPVVRPFPRSDSGQRADTLQRGLLAGAAIALLAAAAYVGQRGMSTEEAMPEGAASPPPSAAPERAQPPLPVELPTAMETTKQVVIAPTSPRPHASSAPSARRSEAKAPARPTAQPVTPVPLSSFGPVASAPVPAPLPAIPVARTPPPPDRWQLVAEALARCADDGGLSGFICDRRVRLESCDGYWGNVPQCPALREYPR